MSAATKVSQFFLHFDVWKSALTTARRSVSSAETIVADGCLLRRRCAKAQKSSR